VAGQAIDVFLGLEIEAGILPAVADVAAVAGRFVRGDGNAEVIDDGFLAQRLLGIGIEVFPFPVLGAVDLAGGLGVAGEAGLGHFGAGVEGLLQFLELGVVGGGGELERLGFRLGFLGQYRAGGDQPAGTANCQRGSVE
jgi:hypothetical protein